MLNDYFRRTIVEFFQFQSMGNHRYFKLLFLLDYFTVWLILTVLRPAMAMALVSCKSLKASSYLTQDKN